MNQPMARQRKQKLGSGELNSGVLYWTYFRAVFSLFIVVPLTFLCSVAVITVALLGRTKGADRVIRFWARCILKSLGVKSVIYGESHLPESGGAIVTFNHQSHFDIPVLMISTLKTIRFGAKIELFKIPFFGAAMRTIGTLPIARNNRDEVMRIYKEAERRFKENMIYILAPEGTRQDRPEIGRFKKGPFVFAIDAQVPLVPVVIKGAYEVLPKSAFLANIGARSRTIYVRYLPPVSTKGLSSDDVERVMRDVRQQMAEAYERLPDA